MQGVLSNPEVIVTVEGAILPDEATQALVGLRVQQQLSLPSLCEMTFQEPPARLEIASRLAPGSSIRVALRGHATPLFAGEVTAVEQLYGATAQREVRVRGYDLLHRLRKRQPVRVHLQMTPADLTREMVAGDGLSVEAVDSGPLWNYLIQHWQSDFEMLREVADQSGLYLTLRDRTLHLLTLDGTGTSLSLRLGDNLHEARIEVNADAACRSVSVTGWNSLRVERVEGTATRPRVGRRVPAGAAPAQVGGDGEREMVNRPLQNDPQAEALAQAELDRRSAGEVIMRGTATGDPELRPGAPVLVEGVAPEVAGRYILTAITHTLDSQRGFLSTFSTAPPPPQPRTGGAIASLGVVTQVNDPEGLGRVRVRLPAYGDLESDWLHVLALGAGAGKGFTLLPDSGDSVLLLLSNDQPGQAIVLGGLYGMEGPLDSGVEAGGVQRYSLRTRGGHLFRFDDETRSLRLEGSEGSYLELSPRGVRLHAATRLDIDAPGHAVTIAGQTIDFKRQ